MSILMLSCQCPEILNFIKFSFIYLAVLGLSCGMWDLIVPWGNQLQLMSSVVVAWGLSSCGSLA